MIPLTEEETKSYEKQKVFHTCKKEFFMIKAKKINSKYIKKLEIIVTIQEHLEELIIAFVI